MVYVGDVTVAKDCHQAIQMILDKWGKLDIAVNNAGIGDWANAETYPEDKWMKVINVNLKGFFVCTSRIQSNGS